MVITSVLATFVAVKSWGWGWGRSIALEPQVVLKRQFVPQVQGNCEFLSGTPTQIAQALMQHIRQG